MRNTKKLKNNRKKKSIKNNRKKIVTNKKAGAISGADCSTYENDSIGIYNLKYNRRAKDVDACLGRGKEGSDCLYYIDMEIYGNDEQGMPTKNTLQGIQMEMAQWIFTDDKIMNFNTVFNRVDTPMDCVINAGQLIGILNDKEANLLRLTCTSQLGMGADTIVKLFTYLCHNIDGNYIKNPEMTYSDRYIFDFAPSYPASCLKQWFTEISIRLKVGHIMFAGWQQAGSGHVFAFAKAQNGIVYYLDPQVSTHPLPCTSNSDCEKAILNGETPDRMYYILYSSTLPITEEYKKPLLEGLGFKFPPEAERSAPAADLIEEDV